MNPQNSIPVLGADRAGLSRRELIRLGLAAAAASLLPDRIRASDTVPGTTPAPSLAAPAKAVIQIWLWGGPCHLDTFDPKPDAGADYCGPYSKPIGTNVDGMRVCEMFPLLAKQADNYALIRSMTHGNNGHETASYMVQSGHTSESRDVFPGMGSVVSLFRGRAAGYTGLIPPYVVLCEPQGRFSEAGFLGPAFKPFATGGDPAQDRFAVEGVVSMGLTEERQRKRRELLNRIDSFGRAMREHDPEVLADFDKAGDGAYDLIVGDAGKVFDLRTEKDEVRARYGKNSLGQSCLVARRLVEKGVPYITVNAKGWDTHKQHFQDMRRKLPELDQAVSALLEDLRQRGLLSSTIVWVCGEFGRSPRILHEAPWNGGRNHYGKAFSALVAGGGLRGGQVIGATDAKGEEVVERPVHPADLLETIYTKLGIDPAARLPHPEGREVRVLPDLATGPKRLGAIKELL